MRKKYLSALLFGALLFASAGTFTSCKDYDDDINNLQEQINTINTTLSELKAQIGDSGVSSVTFNEATGVLTVVDASGTKTYNVKTTAGEVGEIKVTIDDEKNLVVNGETIGKVGDTVTVNEDGYLCVNGEATEIKAGKYAILENDANGVYTITLPDANGELKTITLPKASATGLVSVALQTEKLTFGFNSGEATNTSTITAIAWGNSAKDITSQGVKGNITKGQFLVGQIGTASNAVSVLPATYDLSAQTLTLVDSKGNVAPVKVSAISATEKDLVVDESRTASTNGLWNLTVEMSSDVTKDNIAKQFKSGDKYILYALAVNGVPYTAYDIAVKTATASSKTADEISFTASKLYNGSNAGQSITNNDITTNKISLDAATTTTLRYEDADLYDAYITFEGTYVQKAELYGVTANGMAITATEKARNTEDLVATVHLISVTGTEKTGTINLVFGSTSVETPTATPAVNYTPSADVDAFWIDVTGMFDGMTAAELEEVNANSQISISEKANQTKFLFDKPDYNYYKSDKKTTFDASKDALTSLAYIKVSKKSYADDAAAGTYQLITSVKTTGSSELCKFTTDVNVTLPTFESIFEKSAAWDGTTVSLALNNKSMADFTTAYKFDTDLLPNLTVNINKIDNKDAAKYAENGQITIVPNVVVDKGVAKDITGEAVYTIGGKLEVKSGDITIHFIAPLEGFALAYYTDGTAANNVTIDGNSGKLEAYVAPSGNKKASGLAISLKGKQYVLNEDVNGVDVTEAIFTFDAKAGNNAKAELKDGALTVSGLAAGTYSTVLTMTVTDGNGIVNKATITIDVKN